MISLRPRATRSWSVCSSAGSVGGPAQDRFLGDRRLGVLVGRCRKGVYRPRLAVAVGRALARDRTPGTPLDNAEKIALGREDPGHRNPLGRVRQDLRSFVPERVAVVEELRDLRVRGREPRRRPVQRNRRPEQEVTRPAGPHRHHDAGRNSGRPVCRDDVALGFDELLQLFAVISFGLRPVRVGRRRIRNGHPAGAS